MIRLVISCAARHRSVTYQLVSQIVFGFFMFSLSLGQTIATYRNIVGRNMLRAFGHLVATCWVLLSQFWPVSNLSQQHPTCCNTSQHGGQTHATCCAQRSYDMLRWHVAIVWPGLNYISLLLQVSSDSCFSPLFVVYNKQFPWKFSIKSSRGEHRMFNVGILILLQLNKIILMP